MTAGAPPRVSIVIPVYNEEGILHEAVEALCAELERLRWTWEILLAENGSSDHTVDLGERLSEKLPGVSIFSVPEPNYGRALREGILRARGEIVICDEIDLCDVDFYRRARLIAGRRFSSTRTGISTTWTPARPARTTNSLANRSLSMTHWWTMGTSVSR